MKTSLHAYVCIKFLLRQILKQKFQTDVSNFKVIKSVQQSKNCIHLKNAFKKILACMNRAPSDLKNHVKLAFRVFI